MKDWMHDESFGHGIMLGMLIGLALWAFVLGFTIWAVTAGAQKIHEAQIASTKLQHRVPEARP